MTSPFITEEAVKAAGKAIYERRNGAGAKPFHHRPKAYQSEYIEDARAALPHIEKAIRESAQAERDLIAHWHDFCDGDYYEDGFEERMERAGLVKFGSVTQEEYDEEPFAHEKGLVVGGPTYRLTDAGKGIIAAAAIRARKE